MVRLDICSTWQQSHHHSFLLFWTQTERGAKVDHLCPLATVVTKRGGGL